MEGVVELECGTNEKSILYGSGFIVENNGVRIISNAHVATYTENNETKSYEKISARFFDSEQKYDLYVVSYDTQKDIAVLGFSDKNISCKVLSLNTDHAKYGEWVFTIGNARGYWLSVKDGLVSIPEIIIMRNGVQRPCVVVSAPINEGDSGGPVLNADGKVIGMMSFRLRDDSNSTIQGMSYAITSNEIKKYLDTIPN
jgi:serine protease Do